MPVAHVLGKLGAADSTEAGTGPGNWALVPGYRIPACPVTPSGDRSRATIFHPAGTFG